MTFNFTLNLYHKEIKEDSEILKVKVFEVINSMRVVIILKDLPRPLQSLKSLHATISNLTKLLIFFIINMKNTQILYYF